MNEITIARPFLLKKKCFSSILFIQNFSRENSEWVLDRKHFDSFFLNLVELILFVCVKNIIYITKTWTLLRLCAMLLLYEHYIIAGVLATRPNASRKMLVVSFWSECFVTGRGSEGTIPRFIAFNIFEPKTHLCTSI